MKKEQFRTLVKEIIMEVIEDMHEIDSGGDENDAPVDLTGVRSPTSKTDKRWRGKMRTLDKIKSEPDFQDKLKKVQQRHGDAPHDHKTL
jgi:hypothetical protein